MRPLYCDESIWVPVADGLRRREWTVYTARDEGILGTPDRDQLEHAVENDWILVTFDDNFLSLVEEADLDHTGIIYVQQAGRDIGDVVKTIDAQLQNRAIDDRGIHYCCRHRSSVHVHRPGSSTEASDLLVSERCAA